MSRSAYAAPVLGSAKCEFVMPAASMCRQLLVRADEVIEQAAICCAAYAGF